MRYETKTLNQNQEGLYKDLLINKETSNNYKHYAFHNSSQAYFKEKIKGISFIKS